MCAPAKFTCFGAGRQKMVFPGGRGALSALTRHFPTAVGKLFYRVTLPLPSLHIPSVYAILIQVKTIRRRFP